MLFNYQVKNQQGKPLRGVVEAATDKNAATLLREQGFLIINITAARSGPSLRNLTARVTFSDIVNFTRQVSTMIIAGLTLSEAISLLRNQMPNPVFARVLDQILHDIESGGSFASALEKYPKYFSRTYIALIQAGEAAGILDQTLARLADNLEKDKEFKGKITSAMLYPAIVVIGMLVVGFLMMTLVIPKMISMYKDFGVALPITTKILMFVSDFFANYWWLMILGIIGTALAFRAWKKTAIGAHLWDAFIFRLPIVGNLIKQVNLTEFCRTLGLLVGSGLPILEALNIVSESMNSIIYREGLKEVATKVEKGFSLGALFSQNENFPAILGQMAKVGEETGKLDVSLLKLSSYFEAESEHLVKGLTTAIEPLIMIILGVGVGFLIFSIIMPIYQLTSAF